MFLFPTYHCKYLSGMVANHNKTLFYIANVTKMASQSSTARNLLNSCMLRTLHLRQRVETDSSDVQKKRWSSFQYCSDTTKDVVLCYFKVFQSENVLK